MSKSKNDQFNKVPLLIKIEACPKSGKTERCSEVCRKECLQKSYTIFDPKPSRKISKSRNSEGELEPSLYSSKIRKESPDTEQKEYPRESIESPRLISPLYHQAQHNIHYTKSPRVNSIITHQERNDSHDMDSPLETSEQSIFKNPRVISRGSEMIRDLSWSNEPSVIESVHVKNFPQNEKSPNVSQNPEAKKLSRVSIQTLEESPRARKMDSEQENYVSGYSEPAIEVSEQCICSPISRNKIFACRRRCSSRNEEPPRKLTKTSDGHATKSCRTKSVNSEQMRRAPLNGEYTIEISVELAPNKKPPRKEKQDLQQKNSLEENIGSDGAIAPNADQGYIKPRKIVSLESDRDRNLSELDKDSHISDKSPRELDSIYNKDTPDRRSKYPEHALEPAKKQMSEDNKEYGSHISEKSPHVQDNMPVGDSTDRKSKYPEQTLQLPQKMGSPVRLTDSDKRNISKSINHSGELNISLDTSHLEVSDRLGNVQRVEQSKREISDGLGNVQRIVENKSEIADKFGNKQTIIEHKEEISDGLGNKRIVEQNKNKLSDRLGNVQTVIKNKEEKSNGLGNVQILEQNKKNIADRLGNEQTLVRNREVITDGSGNVQKFEQNKKNAKIKSKYLDSDNSLPIEYGQKMSHKPDQAMMKSSERKATHPNHQKEEWMHSELGPKPLNTSPQNIKHSKEETKTRRSDISDPAQHKKYPPREKIDSSSKVNNTEPIHGDEHHRKHQGKEHLPMKISGSSDNDTKFDGDGSKYSGRGKSPVSNEREKKKLKPEDNVIHHRKPPVTSEMEEGIKHHPIKRSGSSDYDTKFHGDGTKSSDRGESPVSNGRQKKKLKPDDVNQPGKFPIASEMEEGVDHYHYDPRKKTITSEPDEDMLKLFDSTTSTGKPSDRHSMDPDELFEPDDWSIDQQDITKKRKELFEKAKILSQGLHAKAKALSSGIQPPLLGTEFEKGLLSTDGRAGTAPSNVESEEGPLTRKHPMLGQPTSSRPTSSTSSATGFEKGSLSKGGRDGTAPSNEVLSTTSKPTSSTSSVEADQDSRVIYPKPPGGVSPHADGYQKPITTSKIEEDQESRISSTPRSAFGRPPVESNIEGDRKSTRSAIVPQQIDEDPKDGCFMQICVLEKHVDGCKYRKNLGPGAQKIGEYDVISRQFFRTCMPCPDNALGGPVSGKSESPGSIEDIVAGKSAAIPVYSGRGAPSETSSQPSLTESELADQMGGIEETVPEKSTATAVYSEKKEPFKSSSPTKTSLTESELAAQIEQLSDTDKSEEKQSEILSDTESDKEKVEEEEPTTSPVPSEEKNLEMTDSVTKSSTTDLEEEERIEEPSDNVETEEEKKDEFPQTDSPTKSIMTEIEQEQTDLLSDTDTYVSSVTSKKSSFSGHIPDFRKMPVKAASIDRKPTSVFKWIRDKIK